MHKIIRFGINRSSKLVRWDPYNNRIFNRNIFQQLYHKLIDALTPGHFEMVLRTSARQAISDKYTCYEKSGQRPEQLAGSPSTNDQANWQKHMYEALDNLLENGKPINAEKLETLCDEHYRLLHAPKTNPSQYTTAVLRLIKPTGEPSLNLTRVQMPSANDTPTTQTNEKHSNRLRPTGTRFKKNKQKVERTTSLVPSGANDNYPTSDDKPGLRLQSSHTIVPRHFGTLQSCVTVTAKVDKAKLRYAEDAK